MAIAPGALVRPVLARVIGALAARADFSVDRLSDTVLLGDAVSSHQPGDFAEGRVEIAIKDGDGTLDVRVGPLVEGGGERILAEMEVPARAARCAAWPARWRSSRARPPTAARPSSSCSRSRARLGFGVGLVAALVADGLRSCSSVERRIRETCICETPTRSAISLWVMSSTKRR